jgi:hypothetical protein
VTIIKFIIVNTNLIINSKIWSYLQNLIVDRKYLLIIEKKLLITVLDYWCKKYWQYNKKDINKNLINNCIFRLFICK